MLRKLYNWLRGVESPKQSVPVIHLRSYDELNLTDEELHQRCRDVMEHFGTTTVESDHYILDYHDLNTKPFPDEVKNATRAYQLAQPNHIVVVRRHGSMKLNLVTERLTSLLLDCYGFRSLTVISFDHDSDKGKAYLYQKDGSETKNNLEVTETNFKLMRSELLFGHNI